MTLTVKVARGINAVDLTPQIRIRLNDRWESACLQHSSFEDLLGSVRSRPRFQMQLFALFALIAMTLAAIEVLFEVRASDPMTLAVVTFTLGGVAVVASYLPALRASRVNPVKALKQD